MNVSRLSQTLVEWYQENQRPLPWRQDRDPYRIWISEIMLQQTTVTAVIPYYERFLKQFPNPRQLALAPLEEVLQAWAGLGYYSRARNLHKAAQALHSKGDFPKTTAELLELPGFGPYTARAVASLAFDEAVGVIDGNVIRVLSRLFAKKIPWWRPAGRHELQNLADQLAQRAPPHQVNQALMELGATICTPQNPTCLLCPWQKFCGAQVTGDVTQFPLKKPRRRAEIWMWEPELILQKKKMALQVNTQAPFLKGQWLFPGTFKKLSKKPKTFDLRHSITHHEIYIKIKKGAKSRLSRRNIQWVEPQQISKITPSSLLQKILRHSP